MNKKQKWIILSIKSFIIFFVIMTNFIISKESIAEFYLSLDAVFNGRFLQIGLFVYFLLMMIPFFPGVELGLALIMLFREKGILLVYLSTVVSLVFSYLLGRYFQNKNNYRKYIERFLSTSIIEKVKFMPSPVLLLVLINTPGNVALGGGGGIALTYGLLEKLSFSKFIISITFAVAPIPFIFYLNFKQGVF